MGIQTKIVSSKLVFTPAVIEHMFFMFYTLLKYNKKI
jgi:hypothetical protein